MVPAPKTQRWRVSGSGVWEPTEKGLNAARLRPLAHVALRDQVIATALMLCLADRVETLQGDPRKSVRDRTSRRQVISYGNRLFCDGDRDALRHRWGSAKLYRAGARAAELRLPARDGHAQGAGPRAGAAAAALALPEARRSGGAMPRVRGDARSTRSFRASPRPLASYPHESLKTHMTQEGAP